MLVICLGVKKTNCFHEVVKAKYPRIVEITSPEEYYFNNVEDRSSYALFEDYMRNNPYLQDNEVVFTEIFLAHAQEMLLKCNVYIRVFPQCQLSVLCARQACARLSIPLVVYCLDGATHIDCQVLDIPHFYYGLSPVTELQTPAKLVVPPFLPEAIPDLAPPNFKQRAVSTYKKCCLLQWIQTFTDFGRKIRTFMGTHPSTLLKKHIQVIKKSESYSVAGKLDGLRFLLIVDVDRRVYLTNKAFDCVEWCVDPTWFPEIPVSVLDVEFVGDKVYILDVLVLACEVVMELPLYYRIAKVYDYYKTPREGCPIYMQSYMDITRETLRFLEHQVNNKVYDGCIFINTASPYKVGVDTSLFKWKPPHLNTVDFLLKNGSLHVQIMKPYMLKEAAKGPVNSEYEGMVVECAWVNKGWRIIRARKDKHSPNAQWVVKNIIESISENLTFDVLFHELLFT